MLTQPEDLLPEALEAARGEMIRRNLPPARTASPEADEELRALEILVAEMLSEKAELEAKLTAKQGSRTKGPAKTQGGWYAVLFLEQSTTGNKQVAAIHRISGSKEDVCPLFGHSAASPIIRA